MSFGYPEFLGTVWSAYIQRELEKKAILWDFCWKQFEGEAKHNAEVKILGIGTVTIRNYDGSAISAPEDISDADVILKIDQKKYFNVKVDDVVKAQSKGGILEAVLQEAAYKMALARDTQVASMAALAEQTSSSAAITTAAGAKSAVDTALLTLRENDVPYEGDIVVEIPPFLYALLKDKYIELDTDNSAMLAKGIVGSYDGARVRVTNNLYNDSTDYYAMVRTKKAIAGAGQIDKTEAYFHPDYFADCVRGLNVFGTKIVRPKELYVIKCRKS